MTGKKKKSSRWIIQKSLRSRTNGFSYGNSMA